MRTETTLLRHWLLNGPQLPSGPHRGGVVGGLDAAGRARYVYPEITGYYLTWLSFLSAIEPGAAWATVPPQVADHQRAAIDWLQRELDVAAGPATRYYLDRSAGEPHDWRNDALFSFDLGMVYRGAVAVGASAEPVRARAGELLGQLLDDDGSWLACVAHHRPEAIPARWSTRSGPHLLKVAGGVLALHDHDDGDTEMLTAGQATLARQADGLSNRLPEMNHPALYALEGLLQAGAGGYPRFQAELVAGYRQLTSHLVDGLPPEYRARPGSQVRNDVVAQLLRLGSVLVGQEVLDDTEIPRLRRQAEHLRSQMRPDGGIGFTATSDTGTTPGPVEDLVVANTWTAMFSHQALVFFERVEAGRLVPDQWVRQLV